MFLYEYTIDELVWLKLALNSNIQPNNIAHIAISTSKNIYKYNQIAGQALKRV